MSRAKLRHTVPPPVQNVSDGLVIARQQVGQETILTVELNTQLAAPERSFFADFLSLRITAEGVSCLFGKRDPMAASRLRLLLEISFPHRQFHEQLYRSIVEPMQGKVAFEESVRNAASRFSWVPPEASGTPAAPSTDVLPTDDKYLCTRANAAFIFLHEDDACADFFHLDAATINILLTGGRAPGVLKGIVRVVMSPTLLLRFIEEVKRTAQEIRGRWPDLVQAIPLEQPK